MRRHNLAGFSYSNNSTRAGKLWSWRIQRRAKLWRLSFWSWSHHVWKSRVDKIKCFFVSKNVEIPRARRVKKLLRPQWQAKKNGCPQTWHSGTIRTPAAFWDFVGTFCSKFEHFGSFSEMRRHGLTGLSHSNNSKCAGKLWSWRIQRWVTRRRLTFWNWSHRVWRSRVDKIKSFCVNFFVDFKLNFWSTTTFQPWWDRLH